MRTFQSLKLSHKHVVRHQSNSSPPTPKSFHLIPGPKPLPLIGNIWRYLPIIGEYKPETLFENAQYNKKRYGPIVRENITNDHTILHLFDPDDIEAFFRQDGKEPYRRSHRALLKYRLSKPDRYRDGGLFPENGSNWLRLRGLFHRRLLNKCEVSRKAFLLDEATSRSVKYLDRLTEKGQKITVFKDFDLFLYRWSLACSLSIFLDCDIEKLDPNIVCRLIDSLNDTLNAIDWTEVKSERWNKAPNKCPFFHKLAKSEDFIYDFVNERVDQLIENKASSRTCFLHDWLVGDKLDRLDVVTMIVDSLLAGLHTTAFTAAFTLFNIYQDNEILKRLRNELKGINFKPYDGGSSFLKDCLRETLRLNPVSIGTGRLTQHDEMLIRNYKIPKGVMVIAQTQAICKDPMIFDKPYEFRPDRWMRYRALPRDQRPSPFSWLPYGFGPRACIGQRVANLQIYSLVASLVKRYDIKFYGLIKTKTTLIHTIDGNIEVELREASSSN